MELRQVLKMYLDLRAKEDEVFSAAYANKDKSLDECLVFIEYTMYQKAKEQSEENKEQAVCLAPSDDEIFGLATQYYLDADLKIEGNSFHDARLVSVAATTFTDEEKAKMREEAIEKYQAEVIAEAKQRNKERLEKKQKKSSPVIIPDTPATKEEKEETKVVQMDLFGL